jgi:hypothetical protein
MTLPAKNIEKLTPDDFTVYPVWEFALDLEEVDDLAMRPVLDIPVNDLGNRLAGAEVRLANGTRLWAGIANIFLNDAQKTKRLLGVRFYIGGEWVPLSHEMNVEIYGPNALASRLGLKVEDIFPIAYDVSAFCVGDSEAIRGSIEAASVA